MSYRFEMSMAVHPADLASEAEKHGPAAYVLTTSDDGRPRVIHVVVTVDGATLRASVGRSAAANATGRPEVCVLWPPADDGFSLIADGVAAVDGEPGPDSVMTIAVTSAVRHRPAKI